MKKERVEYLDIEKALLILMMVLGHVFLDGPIRKFVYVFHMPAFLITSGIQYRYSSALEKNYFLFLKSRIFALLIPFLFFEVIGIIYHIVCFGKQQSLFGYIYNTLTQNWNNGASGFLVHLFGVENIIYVVLKRFHSVKLQTLVCIVLFCLAVSLPQGVNSFLGMILMYAAFGIVGYSFFYKVKPSLLLMVITLVVMIASSTFGIYISDCFGHPINAIRYIIGSLSGAYFVLGSSMLINKSRWLSFYGKNTITVLGTHNAILFPIRRFLLHNTDGVFGYLTFLIIVVLEVPIIVMFNRFCPFMVGKRFLGKTEYTDA